mmetsp:Transcript_5895/g.18967  ORF Transcript_5895/g.18967 Transcript_5895/m.18967 type:complete len:218 (-) Transcript_5895:182-835(-)
MPSSPPRAARSLGLLGKGQRGSEAVDGGDGLAHARRDGHDLADDRLAARRRLRILPLERRALRRHATELLLHPALRRDQRLKLKAQLRLLFLQAQYLERTAQRQLGGRERLPRQRRQPRRLLLHLGRRLLCRLDLCLRRRLRRRRRLLRLLSLLGRKRREPHHLRLCRRNAAGDLCLLCFYLGVGFLLPLRRRGRRGRRLGLGLFGGFWLSLPRASH